MDVKQYLRRYRWHSIELDRCLEDLSRWRARLTRVGSPTLGRIPGTAKPDYMAEVMATIDEIERECLSKIQRIHAERGRIDALIAGVSCPEARAVLGLRYMSGLSWGEIADKLGYSLAQVHRYHRLGLSAIRKNVTLNDTK